VLGLALLVGCSGPGSGDSGGGTDSGAADGVTAPEDVGSGAGAPEDTDTDRQVITTASASLTVEDPAKGAQQVSELVESAGGRVDERNEQAASGKNGLEGAFADLVVRVPAEALTDLLADLETVGDVENVSVTRSDVTSTAVDLDARISALQTSVERLQALMAGATSTEDLLAAERELSSRQEELESLQSQRALLADQVELSTLSVHLQPLGVATPGGPEGFFDGLGTGWRALVATVAAAAVVLGILLPWAGIAAVVAAGILVPLRLTRRRTAGPTPAPTPPPAAPPAAPPASPPPTPPAPPQE